MKTAIVLVLIGAILWYALPFRKQSSASFLCGKSFILMTDGHRHRFMDEFLSALLFRDFRGSEVDYLLFQVWDNSTFEDRIKDKRFDCINETYDTGNAGTPRIILPGSHLMVIAREGSLRRYNFNCRRSDLTEIIHYKASSAEEFFEFVFTRIPNKAL